MSRRDKNKVNKARRANAKAKAERENSAREYLSFSSNEFNRIESMAAEVFLRNGHHTTVHMVFGKTGGMHMIADATSRGRAVDLVAKTARRHAAVAVVSVGEAWMATGKETLHRMFQPRRFLGARRCWSSPWSRLTSPVR